MFPVRFTAPVWYRAWDGVQRECSVAEQLETRGSPRSNMKEGSVNTTYLLGSNIKHHKIQSLMFIRHGTLFIAD